MNIDHARKILKFPFSRTTTSHTVLFYQQIPLLLNEIDNERHPVEVGVSDAFDIIQNVSGSK